MDRGSIITALQWRRSSQSRFAPSTACRSADSMSRYSSISFSCHPSIEAWCAAPCIDVRCVILPTTPNAHSSFLNSWIELYLISFRFIILFRLCCFAALLRFDFIAHYPVRFSLFTQFLLSQTSVDIWSFILFGVDILHALFWILRAPETVPATTLALRPYEGVETDEESIQTDIPFYRVCWARGVIH